MGKRPISVLISDIHFDLDTLELASASLLRAQFKAALHQIPLVIAGDLHDTKANMRAEVVNKLIQMFTVKDAPETIVLVGNHDRINEKAPAHALNFLRPYCTVVEAPQIGCLSGVRVGLIPYYHDVTQLKELLADELEECEIVNRWRDCKVLIMHQGINGSNMGDYIQDKSALSPEDVKGFRIISGHYHARQTIDLPRDGKWDYIGSPYTMTFGEANDPEKGYQILYDDGSLEFVPLNLRTHVIINAHVDDLVAIPYVHKSGDLLWFKCEGTKESLRGVTKELIAANYGIEDGFKLDLKPIDITSTPPPKAKNSAELMDGIIDSLTNTTNECKERLKTKWKELA